MAVFFFAVDLDTGGGILLSTDLAGDTLAVSVGAAALPNPWSVAAKLLDFTHDLTPPMGGQGQRIARMGARWSLTFSSLPGLGATMGRAILAARAKARATGDTCAFAWPQAAFTAAIGAPAVNGAGQLGARLIVNGLTALTTSLVAGSFFSLTYGGRSHLHALTDTAVVDGGGNTTLSIAPMLRGSPAAGAVLQFAQPVIEGFIQGQSEDWTLERLAWVGLPAFTVTEPA